jgi:tetratricopeptide (TPR) repeat protein
MMIAIAIAAIMLGTGIEAVRLKRYRDQFRVAALDHGARHRLYADTANRSLVDAAEIESLVADLTHRQETASRSERSLTTKSESLKRYSEHWQKYVEEQKRSVALQRAQAAKLSRYAAYHAELRQKYLRASEAPWRSVDADPVPPEPMEQAFYWTQRGDVLRARAAWEEAIKDNPDDASALNNLAWFLSTCPDATLRDGKRGVELATGACTVSSRKNPYYLDTLAAALAECGDFTAAIATQREAIGLLGSGNPGEKKYRARLKLYGDKRPVRDASLTGKSEQ